MVGMVGLYLYDATILLDSDEAVLSSNYRGKWSIFFGAERFHIRSKEPFLPNPLFPHRPMFHLTWPMEGFVGPAPQWVPSAIQTYRALALLVWVMAISLFVLIPIGLFSRMGDIATASGVILFYVTALFALAFVWFKREVLGMTNKSVAALAFESLTCPPFALNLIRHLSWPIAVQENLLSAGRRLLNEGAWSVALEQLILRIDNEIAWEDEGTARAQLLAEHKKQLMDELASCQAKKSLLSC